MNLVGGSEFDVPAIRQRRFWLDVEGYFVEDAEIFEDNFQLGGKMAGELVRTERFECRVIGPQFGQFECLADISGVVSPWLARRYRRTSNRIEGCHTHWGLTSRSLTLPAMCARPHMNSRRNRTLSYRGGIGGRRKSCATYAKLSQQTMLSV